MKKRDTTKKKILEATLKLISQKGYLGATTREIAREAGITEITLFRHFGSKEKLFEEVLKSYTFLPRLKQLIPQLEGLPYEEALMEIGMGFLHTLKEKSSMVRIMLSEITLYPEKIRLIHERFINDMIDTLSQYFNTLQGKGTLREFSPHIGARAFLGMLFSYFKAEEIIKGRNLGVKEMEMTVKGFVSIFAYGTLKDR